MIDVIEELSNDEEWMRRFCADCPAEVRVPATLETPEETKCPAEKDPFGYRGCVRQHLLDPIEEAALDFRAAAERAVA